MKTDYVEKFLKNWGAWMRKRADSGLGYGQSPIARLMTGEGGVSEFAAVVPVDDVEADRTDDAVRQLPVELQNFAVMWYVMECTVRECSRRTGCGTATVGVRLNEVRQGVGYWFDLQSGVAERRESVRLKCRAAQSV